jgi:hypothetical protein
MTLSIGCAAIPWDIYHLYKYMVKVVSILAFYAVFAHDHKPDMLSVGAKIGISRQVIAPPEVYPAATTKGYVEEIAG